MAWRTSTWAACTRRTPSGAVKNARDVYTRRNEGVSIWAVKSTDIVASAPGDKEALFEPANSKVYRHPTFFPMPEEVKHIMSRRRGHCFEYLLRLGDTDVVLAQRLGEWIGHGPVLEEDIALANVGLDLLGQGRMWLELRRRGRGADRAARGAARTSWRSCATAATFATCCSSEMPNGDFARTMARQFYFDQLAPAAVARAGAARRDARIAEIAAKSVKEVTYHAERSAIG